MKYFFVSFIVILFAGILLNKAPDTVMSFSQQRKIDPVVLTGDFDKNAQHFIFNNEPVVPAVPIAETQITPGAPTVLGDSSAKKQIRVDLSQQRLYAYESDQQVYNFLISSGKWHKTPTGTFHIWTKFRYVKMEGGNQALHTYYNLPNVPYTMFFAGDKISQADGFGIHGTYWHHNFGHPMSHGCINMKTEEAGILYNWANPDLQGKKSIMASASNPGTEVVIYGTPPNN